jgi:sugar/nucleoside kinase (ribokinase family)
LYGYLRGYSVPAAGTLGSALGAECVQHLGPAIPDLHWPRLKALAASLAKS